MLKDLKTMTQQGVFHIDCPVCGVSTFVGFSCTDEQFENRTHGLIGFARRKGMNILNDIPDWVHCPACDATLNSEEYDLSAIIKDTTKPQPTGPNVPDRKVT